MTVLAPAELPKRGSSATRMPWLASRRGITLLLVALVPLAAIGPNIGDQGLRTEHAYAILASAVLFAVYGPPRQLTIAYRIVAGSWVSVFLVALIGGLSPVESLAASFDRTLPEGLARVGVPILGLIIGAYAGFTAPAANRTERQRPRSPLEFMMTVLLVVACANSVVAVASVVSDVSWLMMFRADDTTVTVADRVAQDGRFGGVVNQPFEAGLHYSIALITVCRRWKANALSLAAFVAIATLISVGGATSGSKVFLFGGLPVALGYLAIGARPFRPSRLIGPALAALASVLVARYVFSAFNRVGLDRMGNKYSLWNQEEPWSNLFAERLDTDEATMDVLRTIFREAGLFGLGAQGSRWPYDIGIMEFMAVAGWLGAAAMVLISIVLLVVSSPRRCEWYWFALSLLIVGAIIGGAAFTANRNALVIWVLLGAMLQYRPGPQTPVPPGMAMAGPAMVESDRR